MLYFFIEVQNLAQYVIEFQSHRHLQDALDVGLLKHISQSSSAAGRTGCPVSSAAGHTGCPVSCS